jgi:hypothetical protein
MSAKAEEFAKQLLEKTEDGKLRWQFVPDPDLEIYKSDAEDGISFLIKREARGDDKVLVFQLVQPGRVVLSDREDNFPPLGESRQVASRATALMGGGGRTVGAIDPAKLNRFRLYNALFYAAQGNSDGRDQAIEKAEQFLARLA